MNWRCLFGLHRWEKWARWGREVNVTTYKGRPVGETRTTGIIYHRHCEVCGKPQEKVI